MTRVLIVDDRPDVRLAFMYMLQAEGFDVVEVPDGTAALQWLEGKGADVVLTDLHMPVMDGLALVRAVRTSGTTGLLAIVITGSEPLDDSLMRAAEESGADAVLSKPVSRQELSRTIRTLLEERSFRSPQH